MQKQSPSPLRHKHSHMSEDFGFESNKNIVVTKQSKEEDIKHTKGKLDGLIEELNDKLLNHFQQKEQLLLQEYKQQLMKAQRQLHELKANTNQEQIRNKMIARKKELEKERHDLIQTNMFFSNKCETYKKKLTILIHQSKELEREVAFLQGQLEGAHQKRLAIMSEVEGKTQISIHLPQYEQAELPLDSEKKIHTYRQQKGIDNQHSKRTVVEELSRVKKNSVNKIGKSMSINSNIKHKKALNIGKTQALNSRQKLPNNKLFQKTALEQLFEEAVEKVREKRKGKRTMPMIKGQQFSDYEKRIIMQEFLGNENVKKKIYEVIFEQNLDGSAASNNKVKICLDDVGI